MKRKVYIVTGCVLLALNVFITICLRVFEFVHKLINRGLRLLRISIHKYDKRKIKLPKPKVKVIVPDKRNIVGRTKTKFISELPRLKSSEPMFSIQLEKEDEPEVFEEPEINPDDIEAGEKPIKDYLAEEEPEMFSNNQDYPSEELSSGVTMEELTETYNTLVESEPSIEKEEKAAQVLSNIEGTLIGQFFLLQSECMERAKMLMDKNNDEPANFDFKQFI